MDDYSDSMYYDEPKSDRSFALTIILCFFLGVLGIHRFYAGKIFTGIIQLLTGGGFGIWWIIDLVMLLLGKFEDGDGYLIKN